MGLFNWFGGSKGTLLPEICGKIAYTLLPRYAFQDPAKLERMFEGKGAEIGARFYAKICEKAELPQDPEEARQIRGARGFWDGGREYLALEYNVSPRGKRRTLKRRAEEEEASWAPRVSIVVREPEGAATRYYVLSESSEGQTALQEVSEEGAADLGEVCEPTLSALLELLSAQRPWRTI